MTSKAQNSDSDWHGEERLRQHIPDVDNLSQDILSALEIDIKEYRTKKEEISRLSLLYPSLLESGRLKPIRMKSSLGPGTLYRDYSYEVTDRNGWSKALKAGWRISESSMDETTRYEFEVTYTYGTGPSKLTGNIYVGEYDSPGTCWAQYQGEGTRKLFTSLAKDLDLPVPKDEEDHSSLVPIVDAFLDLFADTEAPDCEPFSIESIRAGRKGPTYSRVVIEQLRGQRGL